MDRSRPVWGWHQLDPTWAERLVVASGVGPGDLVLDIGAGLGALTRPLLEQGARVIAVERHPARAAALRRELGTAVTVVRADAADLRLPRRPFHVVANPPYGITTALLGRLLHPGSRLIAAHLVLQASTARRWADGRAPGARRWTHTHQLELGPHLPRRAFRPPPSVESRVLIVRRR